MRLLLTRLSTFLLVPETFRYNRNNQSCQAHDHEPLLSKRLVSFHGFSPRCIASCKARPRTFFLMRCTRMAAAW